MAEEFHLFEESLKAFLNEAQSDSYNSRNANFYKYNNLKIYMNPKKNSMPHFIVRIGISEVMYNSATCEKISGSLGVDERLVRRWLDRNFSRMDLNVFWKNANRTEEIKIIKQGQE